MLFVLFGVLLEVFLVQHGLATGIVEGDIGVDAAAALFDISAAVPAAESRRINKGLVAVPDTVEYRRTAHGVGGADYAMFLPGLLHAQSRDPRIEDPPYCSINESLPHGKPVLGARSGDRGRGNRGQARSSATPERRSRR